MSDPVTWGALVFLAGVIVGSVGWTFWFWSVVASRSDLEKLKDRLDRHIDEK